MSVDLAAIRARLAHAHRWIKAEADDKDGFLPLSVREHFQHDVPALLAVAEAAHAYITFPGRPEMQDPEADSWDEAAEHRYLTLRAAVLGPDLKE